MKGPIPFRGSWLIWLPAMAVLLAPDSQAAVIASDGASDPAYRDGWQGLKGSVESETGSDNGGSGFLPWNFEDTYWQELTSPYPQPHYIDTKPSSYNDLGAPAFALTDGNLPYEGYTTTAARPFAAAMAVGDQISVEVDNPLMQLLAPFDTCGFIIRLRTEQNRERFALYTTKDFNDNQWTITDLRGSETPTGFTDKAGSSGFKIVFKLTGEEDYRLTIAPRDGDPLTFTGQLKNPGTGALKSIEFITYGNGSGDGHQLANGEHEFYFNDLLIESGPPPGPLQRPSDCNQDGKLDLSDVICLLLGLFSAESILPCGGDIRGAGTVALLDDNGDQRIDISDAIWLLGFLFQGSAPPVLGLECQEVAGCPDNGAKCAR